LDFKALHNNTSEGGFCLFLYARGQPLIAGKKNRLAGWTQALFDLLCSAFVDLHITPHYRSAN
jgi:hypothetical protein